MSGTLAKLDYSTPYADLNAVLHAFVAGVRKILGTNFVGAYLHGSFAIGDFDVDSDVDFLVILEEDIVDTQLPPLQILHREIFQLRPTWAQHLEGSYIPKEALRHLPPPRREFLYLNNTHSQLIRSNHDDSLVVYWMLREKGVVLVGPEPRSLVSPISTDALRREVLQTIRTWGGGILGNPSKIGNRWSQSFAVVSCCRMLQTLHTGTVESKRAGVAWGMAELGSSWGSLIRDAWKERPDPSSKVRQNADPDRVQSTLEFIRHCIDRSEES
jgi:Aminoglycoside adenylyltransferase, C-terminal domain/Nucleotidyltransferase domain